MQSKRQRKLTRQDKLLADKVRYLREEKGISQEKLSNKLGKNPSYIAYVETYRRGLSLPILYKLSKILGTQLNQLFSF